MGVQLEATTKSSSKRPEPKPDINVTPLVDVVLVLLIIFMVVTPAINDGENVTLPEIFAVDKKKDEMEPIDVAITIDGSVLLDKERIERAELEPKLKEMHEASPERKIMLKADVRLPYKEMRETFVMVHNIGFRGVKLKVLQRKRESQES